MTILLWRRMGGYLAAWWEPNHSGPFDVKWAKTPGAAVDRLNLTEDVE